MFEPKKLLVWVSTAPWQLGEFVAYDLKKVFALKGMQKDTEIYDADRTIAPDSFLLTNNYKNFVLFRSYKQRIADGGTISIDSLIMSNPEYYHTYVIAGDYLYKQKDYARALHNYQAALTKVIATKKEEDHIKQQIINCNKKLGS